MMYRGLLQSACRLGVRRAPLAPLNPQHFAPAAFRAFGAGGDPRAHLNPDGTRPEEEDAENYHDPDPLDYVPAQNLKKECGKTWIVGEPPVAIGALWPEIPQE